MFIGMGLNLPTESRSYDRRGRRVRFWGHDGAFEIWFFVEQEVLATSTRTLRGTKPVFSTYSIAIAIESEVAGKVYWCVPQGRVHVAGFGFLRRLRPRSPMR